MKPLGIGLYGTNGHQIGSLLAGNPRAKLVAVAGMARASLPEALRGDSSVAVHDTLDGLLCDRRVELVSLCSPRRADQAADAIRCLEFGRHVYAEKPAALSEPDLDRVIAAAAGNERLFHEMAGTAFEQPWHAIRAVVAGGAIGEVVQVLVQKSYPYHDRRPCDEAVDGGLLIQAGVHAIRMIEHVAGVRVKGGHALETRSGAAGRGDLRMAASLALELDGGALASVVVNYLNPAGFGRWGNESLRIFGTRGFVEGVDGGVRTRLVVGDRDMGPVDAGTPAPDYFERFLNEIEGRGEKPLSVEAEVHPTRVLIRLKNEARLVGPTGGPVPSP
jgi:predicted dehydrogenase